MYRERRQRRAKSLVNSATSVFRNSIKIVFSNVLSIMTLRVAILAKITKILVEEILQPIFYVQDIFMNVLNNSAF